MRSESMYVSIAAEAETLRLSTMPHMGIDRNSSAASITSSLMPACSVPKTSTKRPAPTSNVSGVELRRWGVVATMRYPSARRLSRASAVDSCRYMSIHLSVPRTMFTLGSNRHSVSTVWMSCMPNASAWRTSALAFCGWNMFSVSRVM